MDLEPHYAGVPRHALASRERNPVHVVLDNLRSAFNVGSIFRTADAGLVDHLHLCGMTAFPPNDKLSKTALGAFDYVPWTHYPDAAHAIARLRDAHVPVIAVEITDDAVPLYNYSWPRPVAIVFGHEVTGIAPPVLARCDATVCIPMHGYKNTINVATAFGIVLYEILRQWNCGVQGRSVLD